MVPPEGLAFHPEVQRMSDTTEKPNTDLAAENEQLRTQLADAGRQLTAAQQSIRALRLAIQVQAAVLGQPVQP